MERHPKRSGKIEDILLSFREGRIDLETARKGLNPFSIERMSSMAALDYARLLTRGVPCSVGYGYDEKGMTALMSMLQSCSPGLVVVSIDNGFGTGISGALIARPRC